MAFSLGCGDGPFSHNRQLAREFGSQEFDSAVWVAGGSEARGQMIASLMRSHMPKMTTNEIVFGLLGPSECYVNYDDEPCYVFTSRSRSYKLEFSVNHSTHPGRILGASIGEAQPAVQALKVRSVRVPSNTR